MDCNKDLTMESDFIGMFNPVRGLQKNKGSQGSGGAVDPADITEAVNNYLEAHPVEGIGTMTKSEMLDILRGGDNA